MAATENILIIKAKNKINLSIKSYSANSRFD